MSKKDDPELSEDELAEIELSDAKIAELLKDEQAGDPDLDKELAFWDYAGELLYGVHIRLAIMRAMRKQGFSYEKQNEFKAAVEQELHTVINQLKGLH